jgi:uncharacterized protein
MSFATAQRIVDFAMDSTPIGQRTAFCFFGGEPLLRIDLLRETVAYIRNKERNTAKQVSLAITSNGTLLTEPILDFFRKQHVDLCISIDGQAHVHNLNRCYKDGRGSFDDVLRNLRTAIDRLGTLQVNAVYGPDTIDYLTETVSFFAELGSTAIQLNPNIFACWKEDMYPKLATTYMQIANHYIQSYQRAQEIAVNLMDSKIILLLKGGYECTDKCGMGETEMGFAPSGNIYPCERFIGEDCNSPLCLGSIDTGLDQARLRSLLKHRGNRNEECRTCDLQKYCMNWCGCTNYHMTGQTDLVSPMICESEKAAILAAKHVLINLKNNELFVDHFMKYLHEGASLPIK